MSPMEQLAKQEYERGYSDGKSDFFAAGVAEGEMRARQRMIANRVAANQHPFAASGKPIDHIADTGKLIAEPVKQEPVACQDSDDRRLLREVFMLCEATEEIEATNDFMRGRVFEAKGIRRGIGTWYQDTFCGRSYMGEPVIPAAPVSAPKREWVDLTVSDLDAIIEKHYDDEMDLKAMILDGIAAFKEKNK